jgi:hypothetical protein
MKRWKVHKLGAAEGLKAKDSDEKDKLKRAQMIHSIEGFCKDAGRERKDKKRENRAQTA